MNLFLTLEVEIRAFPLIELFFVEVKMLIRIPIGTIIGLTSAGFGFGWAHRKSRLWFFIDESVTPL